MRHGEGHGRGEDPGSAALRKVGGDPVRPYVLLMNSHDGSTAVIAATTLVRVVCMNTLNPNVRIECAIRTCWLSGMVGCDAV